jgi:hypothetical protein
MRNCEKYGISLFFLKPNLEVYAAIEAAAEGNYVLRDKQYHFQDELLFSKNLVIFKRIQLS